MNRFNHIAMENLVALMALHLSVNTKPTLTTLKDSHALNAKLQTKDRTRQGESLYWLRD
jgi:hypothetical protein